MKFIVLGESSGATLDQVMAVYSRHKALADQFIARGDVLGMGPFALEGLVKSYTIREWNDSLLK
jgi:uncharacterized protein YciI